jgi:hypothetical protein
MIMKDEKFNKTHRKRIAYKHHSVFGLISIVIADIAPILYFGGTRVRQNLYAEFPTMEPPGIWFDIANWSILISIFLPFAGMLLAIIGVFQKNRSAVFPILGFLLSCLLVMIPTFCYFTWAFLMNW